MQLKEKKRNWINPLINNFKKKKNRKYKINNKMNNKMNSKLMRMHIIVINTIIIIIIKMITWGLNSKSNTNN